MSKTIVAIATPPGIGGISVIRLSGDEAFSIADKCFTGKIKLTEAKTHTIHYGLIFCTSSKIIQDNGAALPANETGADDILYNNVIDTVTASVFRKPNSYTGEDVVEIGCHGGMLVANEIVNLLIEKGATLADPGEFTKRAFLNGRLDLMQAEAVADLIHSVSIPGTKTAARQLIGKFTERLSHLRQQLIDLCALLELELDFADEDLEFVERNKIADKLIESINYCKELANSYTSAEILRSGYLVGIAGYPNSGKSTLFNALLRRPRAIVSHIPGTTRDYIEESLFLNGITVKLIDTAGIRDTQDFIEIEGIKFVESILKQSNMILILNDLSVSRTASDDLYKNISSNYPDAKVILVHNKIDLIDFSSIISKQNSASSLSNLDSGTIPCVYISAKESIGIQQLEEIIEAEASSSTERINDVLINRRHSQLLNEAASELGNALDSLKAGWENELVSIDIRQAIKRIGELTGETWNEEILNSIFSRFCIGK